MQGGRLFRVLGLLPGDVRPPPRTGHALSPALAPPSAQASLPHMCAWRRAASRPNLTSLLHVRTCLCRQETTFFMLRARLALLSRISVVLLVAPCAWAQEAGPRLAGGSQSLASPQPSARYSSSLPDIVVMVLLPRCTARRLGEAARSLSEPASRPRPPRSPLVRVPGSALSQLYLQLPTCSRLPATCRGRLCPITFLGQMTAFSLYFESLLRRRRLGR